MKLMGEVVNRCVIRRTNALLSKYLPPKVEQVVCCRLTPLQSSIYKSILSSSAAKAALREGGATASTLDVITKLKKLCNHPSILWEEGKVGHRVLFQVNI